MGVTLTKTKIIGTIRPEEELLLCCSRTVIDPQTAQRINVLLQKDIDWEYLINKAIAHGVMPLLFWNLNATCPKAVPKNILAQLRDYFHANAQHNLFLTRELLKLLSLFQAQNIVAIPFKGPVLAVSIYQNLSFRQFGDLDILVHQKDVRKAKNILISQGYQPLLQLTDAEEEKYLSQWCDYSFARNDESIFVELHWRFTSNYFPFKLTLEHLCDRLECLSLAGTTVINLHPEDLLLYLCVHGCKHVWQRLAWICDIAELLRYPQLDWKRIIDQAQMLGVERMLLLGLLLTNDLLGTALPEEVWQRMQVSVVSLAVQVRQQLFAQTAHSLGIYKRASRSVFNVLFRLKMQERLQDRLIYFLYITHFAIKPDEKDQKFLPLPTSLSSLYYLIRPVRLISSKLLPLKR